MLLARDLIDGATSLFKVNLLIVDDDQLILKALTARFDSPLFQITTAENYNDACLKIAQPGTHWHCWILDIDLGDEHNGFDIVKLFPDFHFVIVLSGLRSMHLASEAIARGAMYVFDKNPDLFERLHDAVCKVAALGYLLHGNSSHAMNHFLLLERSVMTSIDEWAAKACVDVRHLQRICEARTGAGARNALSMYYGLYSLLRGEIAFSSSEAAYFDSCVRQIVKEKPGSE
jgi:ActR/RegA family two-component response regulator